MKARAVDGGVRKGADFWWPWWFWLGLFALGAGVRLRQYAGCASYWYDEAFLLLNVFRRSFADLTGAVDYQVVTPLLFLWLERAAYLLLGPAEWAMRLPMIVQSLAALALMVPLARRVVGGGGWVWAVALLALSPHAIMHGVDVRPYMGDVLFCQAVLLATFEALAAEPRRRHIGGVALILLALLGPWVSFPSTFVLGGAGVALLARTVKTRDGRLLRICLLFGAATVLSAAAVYFVQARHLYYPGLRQHWSRGFPALASPVETCAWTLGCLLGMGHYANQSLGLPLLLLGTGGAIALLRRARAVALLLVAPPLLGVAAAFLHRYPMDDRTLFYTAPCVWLLAARGIGALQQRLRHRPRLVTAALGLLLLPGLVESCKELVVLRPRADFRAAFDHVRAHQAPGDKVWVSYSEVYESYYGAAPELLTNRTSEEDLIAAARRNRLWLVCVPSRRGKHRQAKLFARLNAAGCILAHRHSVYQLEIVRYDPPAATARQESVSEFVRSPLPRRPRKSLDSLLPGRRIGLKKLSGGGTDMLTVWGEKQRQFCDGISRRSFLKVGALSVGGLTLADLLRLKAQGAAHAGTSGKAIIMVYLNGGPSHIDLYDMKPDAPAEYRGEFKPIKTNVPGMDVCELLPLQARIADKLAIIRNMKFLQQGHTPPELYTGFLDGKRPSIGSVVSKLRSDAGVPTSLPSYVYLGDGNYVGGPAFLGAAHRAYQPGAKAANLGLAPGMTLDRLSERRGLLRAFDGLRRELDDARGNIAGMDSFTAQALEMVSTNRARDAFDISKEPERVRAKYGKGTEFLQARRLVEAGVPVVTLTPRNRNPGKMCNGEWDHHDHIFRCLRAVLPQLDQSIYALVTDLHERGLDRDVAVVVWGEMGRTPRVGTQRGTTAGRDHWPDAGFALLAGGGLRMGQVVGATNARGEHPVGRPNTPQNVLATLYSVLGIDPVTTLPDHTGRPIYLLDDRRKIAEVV